MVRFSTAASQYLRFTFLRSDVVRYWDISMANVDNIQHDNAVQVSACTRLGIEAEVDDAKTKGGQWTPRPLKKCVYTDIKEFSIG